MSKKENLSSREPTISATRKLGQVVRALNRRPDEVIVEFIREDEELADAFIQGATDVDIARSEERDKQGI